LEILEIQNESIEERLSRLEKQTNQNTTDTYQSTKDLEKKAELLQRQLEEAMKLIAAQNVRIAEAQNQKISIREEPTQNNNASSGNLNDSQLDFNRIQKLIDRLEYSNTSEAFRTLINEIADLSSNSKVGIDDKIRLLDSLLNARKCCTNAFQIAELPLAVAKIGISGDEQTRGKALAMLTEWGIAMSDKAGINIAPALVQIALASVSNDEKFQVLKSLDLAKVNRGSAEARQNYPLAVAEVGISGDEQTRGKALDMLTEWGKTMSDKAGINIAPALVQIALASVSNDEKFQVLKSLDLAKVNRGSAEARQNYPLAVAEVGISGDEQTRGKALDMLTEWEQTMSKKASINIAPALDKLNQASITN
jgi:hypothetical protein